MLLYADVNFNTWSNNSHEPGKPRPDSPEQSEDTVCFEATNTRRRVAPGAAKSHIPAEHRGKIRIEC